MAFPEPLDSGKNALPRVRGYDEPEPDAVAPGEEPPLADPPTFDAPAMEPAPIPAQAAADAPPAPAEPSPRTAPADAPSPEERPTGQRSGEGDTAELVSAIRELVTELKASREAGRGVERDEPRRKVIARLEAMRPDRSASNDPESPDGSPDAAPARGQASDDMPAQPAPANPFASGSSDEVPQLLRDALALLGTIANTLESIAQAPPSGSTYG